MYGIAANCVNCKILASQVFYNSKKERVCSDCIQGEHDKAQENLKRAFDELYNSLQKGKQLEQRVSELEQKIVVYDGILEQIRNFTVLIKKE